MALITKLNNIANAIAAKTGQPASSYTIDNMPTAIASIQTDFPVVPDATGETVRFIDYDGTIITEITLDEAHALTALPPLPTHTGLTATGWTHSLQSITNTDHFLNVGAMYQWTDNPDTTVFKIWPDKNMVFTIHFDQDVTNGVEFDWGDGSATETVAGTGLLSISHTYSTVNLSSYPYLIKITPVAGTNLSLGRGSYNMMDVTLNGVSATVGLEMEAIFGKCEINGNFQVYCCLRNVIISQNASSAALANMFYRCRALKCLVIPQNVAAMIGNYFCGSCRGLRQIVLPEETVNANFGQNTFQACDSLDRIVVPEGMANFSNYTFQNTESLKQLYLPASLNGIGSSQCFMESGIPSIRIPGGLVNLQNGLFASCNSLKTIKFDDRSTIATGLGYFNFDTNPVEILDFTDCAQVATFQNATAAQNFFKNFHAYTRILVPSSLEASWKVATYWSDYASQIVGV